MKQLIQPTPNQIKDNLVIRDEYGNDVHFHLEIIDGTLVATAPDTGVYTFYYNHNGELVDITDFIRKISESTAQKYTVINEGIE